MHKRVHNFSAGPSTLPVPVLEEIQSNLLALPGAGASVLEISHRSKTYDDIYTEAVANLRQLLEAPDNYHVLFLQGGATTQFSMVPMNLMGGESNVADYIVTGVWGNKALAEARKQGAARPAWDGGAEDYTRVPIRAEMELDPYAAYVHFTSNETIQGVEWREEPWLDQGVLVCDASSDFLSRPIDITRYGLIYAGAQKNVGPAGVTIVIIRDDLLERIPAGLPVMLDYRTHVNKQSGYNTPPVFAVYVVMLVTRWLRDTIGGLKEMQHLNIKKANLLYELIDESGGFYRGHANPSSRSLMNVTFRLANEELEAEFLRQALAHDLHQLKGHRSVGGLRASIYNAMTLDGVRALRDCMREFMAVYG